MNDACLFYLNGDINKMPIIQNLERQVLTILPDKKNVDILTNRAGQRDPDNTLKSIGYRKFYRFLWLVEMVYG